MTSWLSENLKIFLIPKKIMLVDLLPVNVTGHCKSVFLFFIGTKFF